MKKILVSLLTLVLVNPFGLEAKLKKDFKIEEDVLIKINPKSLKCEINKQQGPLNKAGEEMWSEWDVIFKAWYIGNTQDKEPDYKKWYMRSRNISKAAETCNDYFKYVKSEQKKL